MVLLTSTIPAPGSVKFAGRWPAITIGFTILIGGSLGGYFVFALGYFLFLAIARRQIRIRRIFLSILYSISESPERGPFFKFSISVGIPLVIPLPNLIGKRIVLGYYKLALARRLVLSSAEGAGLLANARNEREVAFALGLPVEELRSY